MERQLHATAEAAQAAAQTAGPSEVDAVGMAALAARMEQAEVNINKVEQMSRGLAAEHQNNGQQMFANMNNSLENLRGRVNFLESNSVGPAASAAGAPAAAQTGMPQHFGTAAQEHYGATSIWYSRTNLCWAAG